MKNLEAYQHFSVALHLEKLQYIDFVPNYPNLCSFDRGINVLKQYFMVTY